MMRDTLLLATGPHNRKSSGKPVRISYLSFLYLIFIVHKQNSPLVCFWALCVQRHKSPTEYS